MKNPFKESLFFLAIILPIQIFVTFIYFLNVGIIFRAFCFLAVVYDAVLLGYNYARYRISEIKIKQIEKIIIEQYRGINNENEENRE